MEGVYDDFKINDKYFKAIPRPTKDEYNALDMKIIERGQMEPITVNTNMVILDGHTRFDILTQRGKKVKYVIKHFENDKDELSYVVESNIMRRQLNSFQRIEAIYDMYKVKRKERKSYDAEIDVLNSIKHGNNTAKDIGKDCNYTSQSVNRVCLQLSKLGYVSIESKFRTYGHGRSGGTRTYSYETTDTTDDFLRTHSKKQKGSASVLVGKIIGLSRGTVEKGIALIERADGNMKKRLRAGHISMNQAYDTILGTKGKIGVKRAKYTSRIQCPHCNEIAHKSKFKRLL
jgi:hypothetical protein|tara:strand:+ start:404 stop:1267 length:864 start_codon:yes stop_codon:yes gene_type:complete